MFDVLTEVPRLFFWEVIYNYFNSIVLILPLQPEIDQMLKLQIDTLLKIDLKVLIVDKINLRIPTNAVGNILC